jgi:peptidyl-prolyl cis-trans isomerase A (cyclophilin A)
VSAGLAAFAGGCVFHPPPPLPEEIEAEEARIAAAKASAPPKQTVIERGDAEQGGEAPKFEKGQDPPVGMSPSEIEAFNAAQGDPIAGPFPLDRALSGLDPAGELWAQIVTPRGTMECELFVDRTPLTVANFVALARGLRPVLDKDTDTWGARPYYDGTTFHRVIPGFMIQGGDPEGTGFGNPGYVIGDEVAPDLRHDQPGVLSMANKGPATGSAQFFITLGPAAHLDGKHTVFGQCDEAAIAIADDISLVPRGPDDRPTEPELIETVRIVRK